MVLRISHYHTNRKQRKVVWEDVFPPFQITLLEMYVFPLDSDNREVCIYYDLHSNVQPNHPTNSYASRLQQQVIVTPLISTPDRVPPMAPINQQLHLEGTTVTSV